MEAKKSDDDDEEASSHKETPKRKKPPATGAPSKSSIPSSPTQSKKDSTKTKENMMQLNADIDKLIIYNKDHSNTLRIHENINKINKILSYQQRTEQISLNEMNKLMTLNLQKHNLFSQEFSIHGNHSSTITLSNCKVDSEGKHSVLKWMITTGAIVQVSSDTPCYLDFFYIEKKRPGEYRPLVDGKKAKDRGVETPKVSYTSNIPGELRRFSTKQYRWSSDLTNGYHLIRSAPSPYATFRANGNVYMLVSPAQGFSVSPSICYKIFEVNARKLGCNFAYADNFGNSCNSLEEAEKNQEFILTAMQKQGFTINANETVTPSPTNEVLGIKVGQNLLTLPDDKKDKLTKLIDNKEATKDELAGYYAYLYDIFGSKKTTCKVNNSSVFFDGAKAQYAAAIVKCNDCTEIIDIKQKRCKQASQTISELTAATLGDSLSRKHNTINMYGDALYLLDAQKSTSRNTLFSYTMRNLRPMKHVRSEHNPADMFTRKQLQIPFQSLCSCA